MIMSEETLTANLLTKEKLAELEKKFLNVKGVYDAHVDLDEENEVQAIGIFSDTTRLAKEIKRDVEETFRKVAGFRVNHNKISIVEQQLELPTGKEKRIKFLSAYQIQRGNGVVEGVVNLQFNEVAIEETLQVQQFEMELEYLISTVTAQAIMRVIPEYRIRVDHVREISMGSVDILCVTVSIVNRTNGTGGIYVGATIKSKDLISTVAKATLDALNRRLDTI